MRALDVDPAAVSIFRSSGTRPIHRLRRWRSGFRGGRTPESLPSGEAGVAVHDEDPARSVVTTYPSAANTNATRRISRSRSDQVGAFEEHESGRALPAAEHGSRVEADARRVLAGSSWGGTKLFCSWHGRADSSALGTRPRPAATRHVRHAPREAGPRHRISGPRFRIGGQSGRRIRRTSRLGDRSSDYCRYRRGRCGCAQSVVLDACGSGYSRRQARNAVSRSQGGSAWLPYQRVHCLIAGGFGAKPRSAQADLDIDVVPRTPTRTCSDSPSFASLQCELLDRRQWATRAEVAQVPFHWIEGLQQSRPTATRPSTADPR